MIINSNINESYDSLDSILGEYLIESETNYSNMMMDIGINELSLLEEYGYINEAFNIKTIFEKIKQFFKNLWEGIKKFFLRIGMYFKSTFYKFSIDKWGITTKDLKIHVPKNFSYEGFDYTHLEIYEGDRVKVTDSGITDALNKSEQKLQQAAHTIFSDLSNLAIANVEKVDNTLGKMIKDKTLISNKFRGLLVGQDTELTADQFNDELFKYFRNGESQPHIIKENDEKKLVKYISFVLNKDNAKMLDDIINHDKNLMETCISRTERYITMYNQEIQALTDRSQDNSQAKSNLTKASKMQMLLLDISKSNYNSCTIFLNANYKAMQDELQMYRKIAVKIAYTMNGSNAYKSEDEVGA